MSHGKSVRVVLAFESIRPGLLYSQHFAAKNQNLLYTPRNHEGSLRSSYAENIMSSDLTND